MKSIAFKIVAVTICLVLIADIALCMERAKRNSKNKKRLESLRRGENKASPNADLFSELVSGALETLLGSNKDTWQKCVPLADQWGKVLDGYKDKIDYWPTTVGPLANSIYSHDVVVKMGCNGRNAVFGMLKPFFERRKIFLEGKFTYENQFRKALRNGKLFNLFVFSKSLTSQ